MEDNAAVPDSPRRPQAGRGTRREEPGRAFIEYALLVALVAATAWLVLGAVGSHVHDLFAVAADAL